MKKRSLILSICLVLTFVFAVVPLSGCAALSNEEHIERISARVQERFIDSADYPYTDFTVTILYSTWAGEPQFFMVEFMPYGFFYGVIHRNNYYFRSINFYRGFAWTTETGIEVSGGWSFWCKIENSWVLNFRSHFYVFGIVTDRKYLSGSGDKFSGTLTPVVIIENVVYCIWSNERLTSVGQRPSSMWCPIRHRGSRL